MIDCTHLHPLFRRHCCDPDGCHRKRIQTSGNGLSILRISALTAECSPDPSWAVGSTTDPQRHVLPLHAGDNFYNGPNTTSDKRWKTEFMDMYNVTAPFEIMFGNHDYSGLLEAQVCDRDVDAVYMCVAVNAFAQNR